MQYVEAHLPRANDFRSHLYQGVRAACLEEYAELKSMHPGPQTLHNFHPLILEWEQDLQARAGRPNTTARELADMYAWLDDAYAEYANDSRGFSRDHNYLAHAQGGVSHFSLGQANGG